MALDRYDLIFVNKEKAKMKIWVETFLQENENRGLHDAAIVADRALDKFNEAF